MKNGGCVKITKEQQRPKERAPIKPGKKIISKKERIARRPTKHKKPPGIQSEIELMEEE